MKRTVLPLLAALLPVAASAAAPGIPIRPSDRAWEVFGLADRVPVLGDLVDPDCPSVTLLRLHADTRLPPHSASVDRTYLLLSGTLHVGVGKKYDETRMRVLPAGSFWVVPADTSTFEWSEDEAVCQVVSTRPARDCPRPEETVVLTPDRIAWEPSGGTERAVLAGDPVMPGCPHAERLRLPAGATTTPLPAPSAGEVVWTVLSGALHPTGGGAKGPAAAADMPAGTVVVAPGGTNVAEPGPAGAVVQRQFPGRGSSICRWRNSG